MGWFCGVGIQLLGETVVELLRIGGQGAALALCQDIGGLLDLARGAQSGRGCRSPAAGVGFPECTGGAWCGGGHGIRLSGGGDETHIRHLSGMELVAVGVGILGFQGWGGEWCEIFAGDCIFGQAELLLQGSHRG